MDKLRRTIILSIISIGLFAVIGAVLPGISAFDPIDKSLSDISVTDIFYAAERDNSPVENDRFLIIDTSDSDRGEIARAVSLASEAGAAVVAVDIIFSDAAADSSATAALCKAMASNRGLTVSAIHLNEWDDASQSYISTLSTATDSLNLDPGYTNFMTGGDYSYIRNYSVAAAGSVPSFAQATADRYRSIYGDDSPMRPTDTGIIDFSPQAFDIVDAADIAAIDSLASGRMVLLGATDSDEDYHFTPIGRMSGVEIQAYSIDTILSNPSVVAPQWAVWLICVILVMASSAGFVMMRDNFESRNPTANRYTYAVLGLGNIIYPTVIILTVIMAVGLLYLTLSVYLPPLVIIGSLAFIPVSYDLLTISRGILSRRSATIASAIILAAIPANADMTKAEVIETFKALDKNCPFENGEIKLPVDTTIIENLISLLSTSDMPFSDDMYTVMLEYIALNNYDTNKLAAADFFLNSVNSPFLKKGFEYLSSLTPDYIDAVYARYWYKLSLCYYFGLGTDTNYRKSRECLDIAFIIASSATDEEKDQLYLFEDGDLNILGSCLRAKGYPNKVCDTPHGSMSDYTRPGYMADTFIKDCEDALIAEDPENLLSGFPNCKIAVTPANFMRFYPLILSNSNTKAKDFLDRCSTAGSWIDDLTIGLCYYLLNERMLNAFYFNNKITGAASISYYDDGSGIPASAAYFKKASEKFKKISPSAIGKEKHFYIQKFINSYVALSSPSTDEKQKAHLNTIAAACQKVLSNKFKMDDLRFFTGLHNSLLCEAMDEGDDTARFLMGIIYKSRYYYNDEFGNRLNGKGLGKARDWLSIWADAGQKDDKTDYSCDDEIERFKFVVDIDGKPGAKKELAKVAAYEYRNIPSIPEGRFKTELTLAAARVSRLRELAEYASTHKQELDDQAAKFIKTDHTRIVKNNTTKPEPANQDVKTSERKVNFAFRTPDKTKFSEPDFDLTFVTNSRTATYRISGSEPCDIPASALLAGKLRIQLPPRDCEITVVDEAGKMHYRSFVYDETASLRKSATLHILAIGLNDYAAPNLHTLQYAEADAEAIVDTFVKRHQYTFNNINKMVLLGKDVSRNSIERAIETISEAGPNDLAVIFFAGHGLVDSRNYYLATSEVKDADRPNIGGLSATLFKEKISYITCKLIVFIDACHSAKIFDSYRGNDFFKELQTARNGTSIYTSSSPDEKSRENPNSGHGYFTQALLEACDFDKSDTDGDGRITIKEIRNYLERRIPELTNKGQTPVYRNLEETDYSVFFKQ